MTQMALSGHDMIFATSFGYMDPVINVAAKFPNVKFEMQLVTDARITFLHILPDFMKAELL